DPHQWAEKYNTGNTWSGKDFHRAAAYDPACSLSDDAIKAAETLDKFKTMFRGKPPADFLASEADKLPDAARVVFVLGALEPRLSGEERSAADGALGRREGSLRRAPGRQDVRDHRGGLRRARRGRDWNESGDHAGAEEGRSAEAGQAAQGQEARGSPPDVEDGC